MLNGQQRLLVARWLGETLTVRAITIPPESTCRIYILFIKKNEERLRRPTSDTYCASLWNVKWSTEVVWRKCDLHVKLVTKPSTLRTNYRFSDEVVLSSNQRKRFNWPASKDWLPAIKWKFPSQFTPTNDLIKNFRHAQEGIVHAPKGKVIFQWPLWAGLMNSHSKNTTRDDHHF